MEAPASPRINFVASYRFNSILYADTIRTNAGF